MEMTDKLGLIRTLTCNSCVIAAATIVYKDLLHQLSNWYPASRRPISDRLLLPQKAVVEIMEDTLTRAFPHRDGIAEWAAIRPTIPGAVAPRNVGRYKVFFLAYAIASGTCAASRGDPIAGLCKFHSATPKFEPVRNISFDPRNRQLTLNATIGGKTKVLDTAQWLGEWSFPEIILYKV